MTRAALGYALPPPLKGRLREFTRTDWRIPALLALADQLLVIALAFCGYAAWDWLATPLAVLVTVLIYVGQARSLRGLENLVHDGSHFNWVRSRRRVNDLLTNLLAAWPVFGSVGDYRLGHLRHHVEFGGSTDPDYIRYQQLDVNGLDRSSLLRFGLCLGRRLATYMRGWWQAAGTHPGVILCGIGWHAAALATASCFFSSWQVAWTWLVFWAVPFLTILPVLRFVAETSKHDYGQPTVFDATISNIGLIHRLVFHPHGDGHHLLHHLFAAVPQYRLPRLHRLLVETDLGRYRESRARTRVLQQPGKSEFPSRRARPGTRPSARLLAQTEESVPMLSALIASIPLLAAVPLEPLAHGLMLAFGLVVPLGPQNLFVFSRGANSPRFGQALPAILTAALCDTALILLAVVGVSAAVLQLSFLRVALLAAGVGFLTYIGWVTWNSRTASDGQPDDRERRTAWAQVAFCCSVSLLNPHAVLDTVAVIGTNSLVYTGTDKFFFAVATIAVSWVWFLTLAVTGRLAGRLGQVRAWLNRISAVLMWITAIYLLTQF